MTNVMLDRRLDDYFITLLAILVQPTPTKAHSSSSKTQTSISGIPGKRVLCLTLNVLHASIDYTPRCKHVL